LSINTNILFAKEFTFFTITIPNSSLAMAFLKWFLPSIDSTSLIKASFLLAGLSLNGNDFPPKLLIDETSKLGLENQKLSSLLVYSLSYSIKEA